MSKAKTKKRYVLHRPGCTLVVGEKTYEHGKDCSDLPPKTLAALLKAGDVKEVNDGE